MISLRSMRARRAIGAWLACALLLTGACGTRLIRQYEYEEEIYLDLDGSATLVVNASIPALVALRGLPLDPAPRARIDRTALRRLFAAAGVEVTRVSRPWRRDGRRFVQIRLEVDDVRRLGSVGPFGWSQYRFAPEGEQYRYHQLVGAPAAAPVSGVGWDGTELVAFRLHLPSRIQFHNARDVETGAGAAVQRGNIVAWEQTLADRLAGVPVEIDVRMDQQSILYRTLAIFGLSFAAAMAALAGVVWWVVRGRPADA
jgi:hypothetical protein